MQQFKEQLSLFVQRATGKHQFLRRDDFQNLAAHRMFRAVGRAHHIIYLSTRTHVPFANRVRESCRPPPLRQVIRIRPCPENTLTWRRELSGEDEFPSKKTGGWVVFST